MLEVSTIIITVLKAALEGMGIDLQPIISDEADNLPLVNYAISEQPRSTKDGALPYNISFKIYTESYNQTLEIVDLIYTTIGSSNVDGFRYEGTQEPQPDVTGELYTETNYSFKK